MYDNCKISASPATSGVLQEQSFTPKNLDESEDLTVSVATAQSKSAFLTSDKVGNLHLQCKFCGVEIPVQSNLLANVSRTVGNPLRAATGALKVV